MSATAHRVCLILNQPLTRIDVRDRDSARFGEFRIGADMVEMRPSGGNRQRLVFYAPTRGLIGYQGELMTDTRGRLTGESEAGVPGAEGRGRKLLCGAIVCGAGADPNGSVITACLKVIPSPGRLNCNEAQGEK